MSDMIRTVAKAIYHGQPRNKPWAVLPVEFQRQYCKLARAAIEAMRTIPQSMVDAGNSALSSNGVDNVEDDDAAFCWQAMIDAALSQNTLHSSSVPSMLGVSTAMTTLAAEESVVPNSDPRPTSSPVSEQAGGDRSSPGTSPSAAQFPE